MSLPFAFEPGIIFLFGLFELALLWSLAIGLSSLWVVAGSGSVGAQDKIGRFSVGDYLNFCLLLGLAVSVLYVGAYQASDLSLVPDAVESEIAAVRLLAEGRYDIVIGGVAHPPRYAPWFAAILLVPAHLVFGQELGTGIHAVFACALLSLTAAFCLGRALGDKWGGAAGLLLLLALPGFAGLSRQIVNHIPALALALLSAGLFLRIIEGGSSSAVKFFLAAGVVNATAASFRPLYFFLVGPFIFLALRCAQPRRALKCLAAAGPAVAAGAVSLAYNQAVFGSIWRNGYHYWTSVPYDYWALTFSMRYLPDNLDAVFSKSGLPIMLLMLGCYPFTKRLSAAKENAEWVDAGRFRALLCFGLAALLPMFVVHLLYFYPNVSFFLPCTAFCAVAAGPLVGRFFARAGFSPAVFGVVVAACVLLTAALRFTLWEVPPRRRLAADLMLTKTPPDALIISGIDPVYLESTVVANSRREILPVSRRVEYASNVICRSRIGILPSPPLSWKDHRFPGILQAGAQEAVERVALDNFEYVARQIGRGIEVYVDRSFLSSEELDFLAQKLDLQKVNGGLFKAAGLR